MNCDGIQTGAFGDAVALAVVHVRDDALGFADDEKLQREREQEDDERKVAEDSHGRTSFSVVFFSVFGFVLFLVLKCL